MIRAKKSLGQNFLISPRVVDAIAKAGEIKKGEIVIEVGPGKGALTNALLSAGALVKAIEKDDRLIPELSEKFKGEMESGRLELIHGDIMESPEMLTTGRKEYKVIANIPYYITGALIRNFLSAEKKPSIMVLMVQKEVARRIIARDGKESILSIAVKAYSTPELVMNVSRGNFFPVPNVDSAVLRMRDIESPFENDREESRFFEILRAGFSQKRKKLIRNLEQVAKKEDIRRAFGEMKISENSRSENLALETWKQLAVRLPI